MKNFPPLFLLLAVVANAEELHLKDGSILEGDRIRVEGQTLVFRTKGLGEIWIPISEVADQKPEKKPVKIEQPPPPPALVASPVKPVAAEKEGVDPSGRTLVLMPTAFTDSAGSVSFEDFELLFLTLSFSPTATTVLTLGALFPVAPQNVEAFTFGFKQRVYQAPDNHFALAVAGSFTKLAGDISEDLTAFWTLNFVGSFAFPDPAGSGNELGGVHIALGDAGSWTREYSGYDPYTYEDEYETITNNDLSFAIGMDARLTPRSKFIVEYLYGGQFMGGGEGAGILNFGVRIHGQHLSADICGFRFVNEEMGDVFLLPMINIGYRF